MADPKSMSRAIEALRHHVSKEALEKLICAAIKEGVCEELAKKDEPMQRKIERLLKNYRLLTASHEDAVFDLKSLDAHPEAHFDDIDDMMRNVISRRDIRLHGVEDARARTHLAIHSFESTLISYQHVCGTSNLEHQRRRWRVIEARYLNENPKTTKEIAHDEFVSERTVQLDIRAAIDDLCVMLRGVDGLQDII